MTRSFTTSGICTPAFELTVENGILTNINIPRRGCDGNLQGISKLVKGMNAKEAAEKLEGIDCNGKGTSCPDQLSNAIRLVSAQIQAEEEAAKAGGAGCTGCCSSCGSSCGSPEA